MAAAPAAPAAPAAVSAATTTSAQEEPAPAPEPRKVFTHRLALSSVLMANVSSGLTCQEPRGRVQMASQKLNARMI